MKVNCLIILIIAIITFIIGGQIKAIYGFDPPYAYFYVGFAIEFISILAGIIALVFLVIHLIKTK